MKRATHKYYLVMGVTNSNGFAKIAFSAVFICVINQFAVDVLIGPCDAKNK